MPAYVLVDVDVTDPETYKQYRAKAPATVTAHGGRYVVRGGKTETLEGDWGLHRCVLLQFDSMAAAKAWYVSADYQKVLPLRLRSARSKLIVLDGLDPDQPLPA